MTDRPPGRSLARTRGGYDPDMNAAQRQMRRDVGFRRVPILEEVRMRRGEERLP
jgi:hypothetical protein